MVRLFKALLRAQLT